MEVNCAFDRYVVLDPLSALKLELTLQIKDSEGNKALSDLLKVVETAVAGHEDNATSRGNETNVHRASLVVNRNAAASWDLGALKFI